MGTVFTVTGEMSSDELGVVLPHEHVLCTATDQWAMPVGETELREAVQPMTLERRGRSQSEPFFFRSVMQNSEAAVALEEIMLFKGLGGGTIVDLGVPGYGRDPMGLKALSVLSGLTIVMGCGEYVQHSHSPFVRGASERQIADVLIRELTEGVGPSGIRAGIIGEIGISNAPTSDELKVVRASVIAQREVGVALNLHRSVFPDPMSVMEAVDLALRAGVAPDRLVVSHCDERPEAEFAFAVAERGAWVELDTFGMEQWAMNHWQRGELMARSFDHHRLELLDRLLQAGYRDQLLLSQDVAMKNQLVAYGGWGFGHITRTIEPVLRARGATEEDLVALRRDNPARMLAVQR